MKKTAIVLTLALLAASALCLPAWAGCISLKGADYYGGDMYLNLHIGAPYGTGQPSLVTGVGTDSRGNRISVTGTYSSSAHITDEYMLHGGGGLDVSELSLLSVFYTYHAINAPGYKQYNGMLETSQGEERTLSGEWEDVACNEASAGKYR